MTTAPLFGVYSQHGDHLGGLTADHAEAMRWAQQRADRTGREVCVGREDGTGDVDWVEPTPHCESGAWSQVRCDGPRETRVRWVPPSDRGTARAAGAWAGLSIDLHVCAACADEMIETDAEWTRCLEVTR